MSGTGSTPGGRARFDIVVPTVGRPSLDRLLDRLRAEAPSGAGRILVVHDRARRGPAAARNAGIAHAAITDTAAPWVVFLDDDVEPTPGWGVALLADLDDADRAGVAAVQGRIAVPLDPERPATDWERNVARLSTARWITADLAVRRAVLVAVGGFDERFPRAYREDSDLALRIMGAGGRLAMGRRVTLHPVRPAPWWISLRLQRGNADDALMDRLHGPGWRDRADAPQGRLPGHLATTVLAAVAIGATVAGRRRAALAAALGWAGMTGEFQRVRTTPGLGVSERLPLLATSVLIPPVATWWAVVGRVRAGLLVRADSFRRRPTPTSAQPDRDRGCGPR